MVASADPHPGPTYADAPPAPAPERPTTPPPDGPSPQTRPPQDPADAPPGAPLDEETDPHGISPGEADRLLADAPWHRFAVLGDGLIAADGDSRDAGWGELVAAALIRRHPDLAYAGLAERERRIAEVRATQLEPALDFRPDLALVVAGGDDILRRDFERCDDVLTDYDAIVTALQRAGADVVTVTMFDVTRSERVPGACREQLRHRLDELAKRVRQVALARGTVHLDLSAHPAAELADIYDADLRFLSRRGQAIAAAALIRRLGAHLAATSGR